MVSSEWNHISHILSAQLYCYAEAEEAVHDRLLKTHYPYRMWELEVSLKITKFKSTFDRQDNGGEVAPRSGSGGLGPKFPNFSSAMASPSSLVTHLALSPRRTFLLLHFLSFPLKLQIWNSVFSYALAFFHLLWGGSTNSFYLGSNFPTSLCWSFRATDLSRLVLQNSLRTLHVGPITERTSENHCLELHNWLFPTYYL